MPENDGPTHVVYKSAVTGKIVTKKFAERHPRTTYKDTVPDNVLVEHNDDHEDEGAHDVKASETDEA